MAACFNRVAGFDGVTRDSNFFKSNAAGGFKRPNLRFALGIFYFEIDPGMRDDEVQFLDHALQINKRIGVVVAVGMMRQGRHSEYKRAKYRNTNTCCEAHVYSP